MTSAGPRQGQHVLTHRLRGRLSERQNDGVWPVVLDGPARTVAYLSPDQFEVIKEPLRVGDVIAADSPEPPIGTTLMDLNGVSARRNGNGMGGWGATWGSSASWEELRRHTWTVQHVGDGAQ